MWRYEKREIYFMTCGFMVERERRERGEEGGERERGREIERDRERERERGRDGLGAEAVGKGWCKGVWRVIEKYGYFEREICISFFREILVVQIPFQCPLKGAL